MSIQNDVHELTETERELKVLRQRTRFLCERKRVCEKRIVDYLNAYNQPGINCGDFIIEAKTKCKRKYDKKVEKLERGEEVLRQHGIGDASAVLDKIVDAMRGEQMQIASIKCVKKRDAKM